MKKKERNPYISLIRDTYKEAMETEEAGKNLLSDLLTFISDDDNNGVPEEPISEVPITGDTTVEKVG